LYSQFLETLAGLTTIRAFGWQKQSNAANNKLLNRAQKPFHLLFMAQRWLGLVLDLVTAGIAILVVGLSIGLKDSVSAGSVGVSLINVISFTSYVRAIVILWTSTETSIGAIARIKSFSEGTASESLDGEDCVPPEHWPSNGAIEFKNVSACYR
jgi:ABC-type multidrug transport system fused ATPase/permease subunit